MYLVGVGVGDDGVVGRGAYSAVSSGAHASYFLRHDGQVDRTEGYLNPNPNL